MKETKLLIKKKVVFKLNNAHTILDKGRTTGTDMTVTSIIGTIITK